MKDEKSDSVVDQTITTSRDERKRDDASNHLIVAFNLKRKHEFKIKLLLSFLIFLKQLTTAEGGETLEWGSSPRIATNAH